jgi:lauroyl/myristoyl acyltransferase
MKKPETKEEKILRLRGIDKKAAHSVERNVRACYPQKTEKEIEDLTLKIIQENIENCKR